MSAKKSLSAAEIAEDEEDGHRRRSHGGRSEPEAEEEEDEEDEDTEARDEKRRDQDEDEGDEEEGEGEEEDRTDEEEVKRAEGEEKEEEEGTKEDGEEEEEGSKERSSSSTSGDQSEYMDVDLADVRKEVQCPICLGIIRKTRTVMECLHRFCRECIDKSMRMGNNECPACRKHCASRRSLRDDPKFDALIAALFTNIDKYEEEEFAFHEEEKACNKQIQASIAQISQRQSDALVKRRSFGKEAVILSRSQRIGSRRRRNCRNMDHHILEDNDDDDDDDNNARGRYQSSDEHCAEIRHRKRRKRSRNRPTHPSTSATNNNSNCADSDVEVFRDGRGISTSLVRNPEIFAWGRGGARSSTRHGNGSGGSNKSARNTRLNRLAEYLRSLEGNSVELDIHLKLVSLDTKHTPNLQQPYLCCQPSVLVKQLREFIALETRLKVEEIELLVARGKSKANGEPSRATASASRDEMQSLEDDETLERLKVDHVTGPDHLIIAYRRKHPG